MPFRVAFPVSGTPLRPYGRQGCPGTGIVSVYRGAGRGV